MKKIPPNFQILPMSEEEYPSFEEECVRTFVDEKMRSEDIDPSKAESLREDARKAYLPEGIRTKNQLFYVLEVEGHREDELAGWIWLAIEKKPSEKGSLFIYDLFLRDSIRGKGIGKKAMEFIESEAVRLGLAKIALHVFGHNQIARSLYEKAGFETKSVLMEKAVPLSGT